MISAARTTPARPIYPVPSPHATSTAPRPTVCSESAPRVARRAPGTDAALHGDALAMSLRAALDHMTPVLARAAAAFMRHRGWFDFGYARPDDHARERFGRCGRWLRDLASLADAFDRLAGLAAALTGADGGRPVGEVAARLISRVATDDSLSAWVAMAREQPVRALREAVARARAAGSSWPVPLEDPGGTGAGGGLPACEPSSDSRWIRMMVPMVVRAAFDETRDLYQAVEGHTATVSSFIEALLAEAAAGPCPPDVESSSPAPGVPRDVVESALARTTGNWSHLPEPAPASRAFALARESLARFRDVAAVAGEGDAVEVDRQIRVLVDLQSGLQRRLGTVLAEMGDRGAWSRLRFAGLGHYAEQRLGLSRTTARDRARAARALRRLPAVREAHDAGAFGLEATLHIIRILGPGSADTPAQREWVDRAREVTIKRLRDESRALARHGAGLPDPPPAGDTGACAAGAGATGAPVPLSDAQWHASLYRGAGTARARLRHIGRVAAGCPPTDVFLRLRVPADLASSFTGAVESACRRLAALVDRVAWDEPWPDPDARGSTLAARMFSIRCRRVPSWVGLLSLLEDFVETWDPPAGAARRRADRVYNRDGWRCTAPGCTSRRNLEDHHLRYRARGGSDRLWNRTTLCRFHHQRGEHGGLASCRGRAPLGIDWRLGRAGNGVRYRNERRIDYGAADSARGKR